MDELHAQGLGLMGKSSIRGDFPALRDGDVAVFRSGDGLPVGEIVLAEYQGPADPDTGGAYTVKRLVDDGGGSIGR